MTLNKLYGKIVPSRKWTAAINSFFPPQILICQCIQGKGAMNGLALTRHITKKKAALQENSWVMTFRNQNTVGCMADRAN